MAKARAQTSQSVPLNLVGSSVFGRYNKISAEQTFNFLIADNFLVPFPGYQWRNSIGSVGRGIYASTRANKMYAVVDKTFYEIDTNLTVIVRGTLNTSSGDVFFAEDLQGNIAVCDKANLWYWNYNSNMFTLALKAALTPLGFTPTYVTFQNGRFLVTDTINGAWWLSDASPNQYFPQTAQTQGAFQTKPDAPIAITPIPGRGNNLLVMGSNVAEPWNDQGLALFPYVKNTSYNLDYGTINPATLDKLDNLLVFLAQNQNSGPAIMFTNGQDIQQISTDGINYKFETLQFPSQSYGFLVKVAGHIIYIITFFNAVDNFSLAYDFTTQKFFTLTDEYMNFFVAKKAVFFNETYYFVSINDGSLYELNSQFYTYQYELRNETIPRVRITGTHRQPSGSPFIVNNSSIIIEQGDDSLNTNIKQQFLITEDGHQLITEDFKYLLTTEYPDVNNYQPHVDLAISNDGGDTYSNFYSLLLNPIGVHANKFTYYNLGYANEITHQFRFFTNGRVVVTDGEMEIYA